MQFVRLGKTGLKVSRLCFGTMNFGKRTDEKDTHRLMDRALELEINFWDTADMYPGEGQRGHTEELLGKWISKNKDKRDQIVLATKLYGQMKPGVNSRGLSAYHIRNAVEDSLKRLQTDHIDLYQMHHIDRETPWEEIWEAMSRLVQEGKVLYVGSSNFAGWHIAHAQGKADGRHFLGLVCEQSLYHLGERTVELEVLPACLELGLGFIAWSPLGGGLLSGRALKPDGEEHERSGAISAKRLHKYRKQIGEYETLCEKLGQQPAVIALAWLLHQPGVTAPIIGPRKIDQLESACRALEMELSQETLDELDRIWPGPGKPAPEAYAW